MSRNRLSLLLLVVLFLVLASPYLYLLKFSPSSGNLRWDWALQALITSIQQATFVVTFCILFSMLFWRSMFSIPAKMRHRVSTLLKVPLLLPSIFTILIGFQLFDPFPFGLEGITKLFLLTYLGFFFSGVVETIESKLLPQILVQKIYNISFIRFDLNVLIPQIRNSIFQLGIIVFIGCFSSLSIPMAASGGKSTNFELFIFETIFLNQNWSAAIGLTLIQAGLLFLGSRLLSASQSKNELSAQGIKQNQIFSADLQRLFRDSRWLLFFPLMYLFFYFGAFSFRFFQGLARLNLSGPEQNEFLRGGLNSLIIFGIVLLFGFLFFKALAYRKYYGASNRFILLFLNPSSAVVGLAFFLVTFSSESTMVQGLYNFLKISVAIFIVYGVSLYYTFLKVRLDQMERQMIVARIYSLNFLDYFKQILMPQLRAQFEILVSFLALLILTEFAVTAVIRFEHQTLGKLIYAYASSYRLSTAVTVAGFVILLWLIVSFASTGLRNRKGNSHV